MWLLFDLCLAVYRVTCLHISLLAVSWPVWLSVSLSIFLSSASCLSGLRSPSVFVYIHLSVFLSQFCLVVCPFFCPFYRLRVCPFLVCGTVGFGLSSFCVRISVLFPPFPSSWVRPQVGGFPALTCLMKLEINSWTLQVTLGLFSDSTGIILPLVSCQCCSRSSPYCHGLGKLWHVLSNRKKTWHCSLSWQQKWDVCWRVLIRFGSTCALCSWMAAWSWTCCPLYDVLMLWFTAVWRGFYVNGELKKFPLWSSWSECFQRVRSLWMFCPCFHVMFLWNKESERVSRCW